MSDHEYIKKEIERIFEALSGMTRAIEEAAVNTGKVGQSLEHLASDQEKDGVIFTEVFKRLNVVENLLSRYGVYIGIGAFIGSTSWIAIAGVISKSFSGG